MIRAHPFRRGDPVKSILRVVKCRRFVQTLDLKVSQT